MDKVLVAEIEEYELKNPTDLDIGVILDCKTSNDLEHTFYLTPDRIVCDDSSGKRTIFNEKIISFDCTDEKCFAITSQNVVKTASIRPACVRDDRTSSLPASKLVACSATGTLLLTIDDRLFYFAGDEGVGDYLEDFPNGRPMFIAAGHGHMVVIVGDSEDNAGASEGCPRKPPAFPSIRSVMADRQVTDFTARLLNFKRLGESPLHSPLGNTSVDETGSYDMQEVTTVLYKWGNDNNYVKLDIPHVIFVSCGKEHTALTTAYGKLYLVGKPFRFDVPAFDSPRQVESPNAFVVKAVAGDYVTVVMLLTLESNQDGPGPVVAVVKENLTLQFCSMPEQSIMLGVSCSRRSKKGIVLLRMDPNQSHLATIFAICREYVKVMNEFAPTAIREKSENPPTEAHAVLFQIMKQLFQSMITLIRYFVLDLFASSVDHVGQQQLLSLLRNHISDIENFWHQLHLVHTHEDLRKALEKCIDLAGLKKKAPNKEKLKILLNQLQGILNNEMLREIDHEVQCAFTRLTESENQSLKWKNVIKDNMLLKFLCSVSEKLILSTLENSNDDDLAAPLKIKVAMKKFDDLKRFLSIPSDTEKTGKQPKSLCLTERHLILSWRDRRESHLIAWNLSLVWIVSESSNSIVITTPEMDLTLTALAPKFEPMVEKWKESLADAISKIFGNLIDVSPKIDALEKYSQRNLTQGYHFQIGGLTGCRYDGEWRKGMFHGRGHLLARGQTTVQTKVKMMTKCEYEGEFRAGLPCGFGTFATFFGYENSDKSHLNDELSAGRWENKHLHGFITEMKIRYDRTELHRQGSKEPSYLLLFYGQHLNQTPFGRGFRFEQDLTSIEDASDPSTGAAKHVTSIDHKKKLVDYTLTENNRRYGEVCINENYWFRGPLSQANEPAGEGVLIWNYSKDCPTMVNGDISVREGRVHVNGFISNSTFELNNRRTSETPEPRNVENYWQLLRDDCFRALTAGHPEDADEAAIAEFVWEKKLKSLLKRNTFQGRFDQTATDAEIEAWQSALRARNLSLDKWELLKSLTRRLLTIENFPVKILIDIRSKATEMPVGFAAMKGSKIYQLIKDDMHQVLADMYFLIRVFLPILPQKPDDRIHLDEDNVVFGREFCSSVLPKEFYTVFLTILKQESQTADNLHGPHIYGPSPTDNYFLESLAIKNENLLKALKEEAKLLQENQPQSDPLTETSFCTPAFKCCVDELRNYLGDANPEKAITEHDPVKMFVLLQHLETVFTKYDQFLRSVVNRDVGRSDEAVLVEASDVAKARVYLFWKAKLPSITFVIDFLKFFMKHRISYQQLALLNDLQDAHWRSLSIASH